MTKKNKRKKPIRKILSLLGGANVARPGRFRVGLAGSNAFLKATVGAYAGLRRTEKLVYFHPDAREAKRIAGTLQIDSFTSDPGDFASMVDAAEVFDIPGGRTEFVVGLLGAGVHASLQKPFARDLDEADKFIRAAQKSGATLRVNEYSLFFEPYVKLKKLIQKMEIGEICAARFRSNLVGEGGFGPLPGLLEEEKGLFHPAFDKAALAIWLLGGVESVCSYANSMDADKGGQALIGFKYRAAGRYGFFDNTYAPQTSIRTDGLPSDDVIEIAGTDGIIWVNHFHGKMTEEPWIEVRRGKKHYTLGIGSDMKLDWKDSLSASAARFLSALAADRAPDLSGRDARRALAFLLAARESMDSKSEVKVPRR